MTNKYFYCWRCGYDRTATPNGPCSECGHSPQRPGYNWRAEADSAAQLVKGILIAAVLSMAGLLILMLVIGLIGMLAQFV